MKIPFILVFNSLVIGFWAGCSSPNAARFFNALGSPEVQQQNLARSRFEYEAQQRARNEQQEEIELRQTLTALYPNRMDEFKQMTLAQLRGEMNAAKLKRDWKEK